jgi:multidrug resistance protein MdtO
VAAHRRRAAGHADCAASDRLCAALDRFAERPAGDDPAGLALAAWIAAGSERIAYAGIQIGFTALAFLSWFGPLSNLTELRDRVIGILLGVLVSSIVHLYLWPDSEAPQLKARLAQLYRQLAQTLAARDDEVQLVPLFAALTESETLINRVAAEPLGTYAHPWPEAKSWPARATFRQAEEILRLSEGYRLYAAPEDTFSPLRPAA